MKKKEEYSKTRSNAKKTIAEWLKLYTDEKDAWYDSHNGLYFTNERHDVEKNFNSLDSAKKSKIRSRTVKKIIIRVNYFFNIEFTKSYVISKGLFEVFLLLCNSVTRSVALDDEKLINGLDRLKKGKLEIIPQEVIDKIKDDHSINNEISELLKNHSNQYKIITKKNRNLKVEKYLSIVDDDFIKVRIITNLNDIYNCYESLCDIKDYFIYICNEEMFKLTGKVFNHSTPDILLKEYKKKSEEKTNVQIEEVKTLKVHYDNINSEITSIKEMLDKVDKKFSKTAKELNELLNKSYSGYLSSIAEKNFIKSIEEILYEDR